MVARRDVQVQLVQHRLGSGAVGEGQSRDGEVVAVRLETCRLAGARRRVGLEDAPQGDHEAKSGAAKAGHQCAQRRLESDEDIGKTTHDLAGGQATARQPRPGEQHDQQRHPAAQREAESAQYGFREFRIIGKICATGDHVPRGAEHQPGRVRQPLVRHDRVPLPVRGKPESGHERGAPEHERRHDQQHDDRRDRKQADDDTDDGDDEIAKHDEQPAEGVPDDLDLAGQPRHGSAIGTARHAVAQRATDDAPRQVVAEGFHQVSEVAEHLAGTDRTDTAGEHECRQPGQAGQRTAGEEAVVDGVGERHTGDRGGHHLGKGPRDECEKRTAAQPGGRVSKFASHPKTLR